MLFGDDFFCVVVWVEDYFVCVGCFAWVDDFLGCDW